MVPFHKSAPGRILLVATAVFLLTGASFVKWGSYVALGIGMPAGITLAFIGVGLGMRSYVRETLLGLVLLPPALWGFMFFIPYASASSAWPVVFGAAGIVAAGLAATGKGSSQTTAS